MDKNLLVAPLPCALRKGTEALVRFAHDGHRRASREDRMIQKRNNMTEKEQQTVDKQINLTEQKLLAAKKTYDTLLNQMNDLLIRRYPERQEAAIKERLYHAFLNSNKEVRWQRR